ncbi:hypothetical protein, partial [Streptomyces sp. NPDC018347]|uniref:hypothetical protein n=1 Tax=Streptomyces sp. NPDC018347 TaxID=3157193 RepID=UPI0033CAF28C
FDAVAAEFDLVVDAADEFEGAVGAPFDEVAGASHYAADNNSTAAAAANASPYPPKKQSSPNKH